MALAYLIDPQNQFMTKSGTINVAGTLRVYDAATDDAAVTYCDFNGTENEEAIVLDNNGRAIVIADSDKAYRLEVYDRYGTLMWTTTPIWCLAGGGGVMLNITELISSDGSISIYKTKVGSTTTFDLGIAPDNAKELLEWSKCYNTVSADGYVYPLYSSGTMNIFTNEGLEVFKDRYYHLTNKITVVPSGNGINYETITVQVMHYDGQGTTVSLCTHEFDIDNSVSDKVELEFSEDIIPEDDGYLFWNVTGRAPFNYVGLDMQVHRIYSGINAVPGSIANKPWVEQNISSKIDYSALEYNQQNLITGISGSAIASNAVDPNDFIPWSASGTFQPSGSYLSSTDSALFQPSGEYVYESAFSSYSSVIDNSITAISSVVSGVSGTYLEKTASGLFQPSGEYLSASESSNYYPMSGNPSGFLTEANASSSYVSQSAFSSYSSVIDNSITAISSVVSGVSGTYLEKTASSMFQESGNYVSASEMSAYAKASSLEDYQLKSDMSAYAYESSVSGKLDSSAFSAVSGTFLTAVPSGYATESYVDSAVSGKLDVTASSQFLTSLPDDLAYTSDVASAVSGKLDASASSEFYPMTGNPSGFLTAHQSLSGYATEQYVDSAVSGKLDATAYDSAQFLLTSQSGMFAPSGNYVSSTDMSAYIPFSGLDTTDGKITGISGTALSAGKVYEGVNPIYVDNTADNIGVYHKSLVVDETMTAYASGDSAVIGVNATYMADFIPVSALGLVEI